MSNDYIINEWALVRRNELVDIPNKIEIHADYLRELKEDEFETAFRQVWELFYQVYTDIACNPDHFGMPLYSPAEYRYGSKEAQESRQAAWRPINLLFYIFKNGRMQNDHFCVDIEKFKGDNRVKSPHHSLKCLYEYGFEFYGLNNFKISPKTTEFTVAYPSNPNILAVLMLVAKKAGSIGEAGIHDLFCEWNYRLLLDGFGIYHYADSYYRIADKMHGEADREFLCEFHNTMKSMAYFHNHSGWNEGPGIAYYDRQSVMDRKGPYLFRLLSWKGDLQLMLRIRNAEKCFDYLDGCPESVKDIFRTCDVGCANHKNGTCNKGVGYIYEGEERWKCGCCNAPFVLHPKTENISHYIKLVELGSLK